MQQEYKYGVEFDDTIRSLVLFNCTMRLTPAPSERR